MIDKETFDRLMMHYSHLGTRKVDATGALLIGHAPHVATEAWLNSTYPCLSESETVELEVLLGTTIPIEYRHFLQNIPTEQISLWMNYACSVRERTIYGIQWMQPDNPLILKMQ